MEKVWQDEAWEAYLYWQTQDKKTLKKINRLIQDIVTATVITVRDSLNRSREIFRAFGVSVLMKRIVWFSVSRMGDSRYGSAVRTIGTSK